MLEKIRKYLLAERQNIALAVACALLIVASIWHLPASPATWFDEGINLGIAKSLINNGVYSLEIAPGKFVEQRPFLITTNYPVLLPVAASLKLFSANLTAARIPAVLFLWGFALAAYMLVKKLYSREAAIFTLALIASFTPFYGNGKNLLGEVPGLFYLFAGLLALMNAERPRRLFFAGLLFGLCAATKPFFLIIIPAIATGIWWKDGLTKIALKRLALIGAGLAGPLIMWLWTILPSFSLTAIFATTGYYSNSYAATGFLATITQNILRFAKESTPLHFTLLAIIVVIAAWRAKKSGLLTPTEVILLTFAAINWLWYLKTPGWYRYFFTAHMVLLALFPAALLKIAPRKAVVGVLAALIAFQVSFTIKHRYDSLYYSNDAANVAEYLNNKPASGETILTLNEPSVAFLLQNPSYQYLQINPALHFGESSLADKKGRRFDYVVARGLSNIGITNVEQILNAEYSATEFGAYTLYSLKKGL